MGKKEMSTREMAVMAVRRDVDWEDEHATWHVATSLDDLL
jgi:hypothetical protein